MNNKEYIAALAARTELSVEAARELLRTVVAEMTDRLGEGDKVQIAGFGTFEVKKRMERIMVNPATKQRMLVPPKLVINFKPVTAIKDKLNSDEL